MQDDNISFIDSCTVVRKFDRFSKVGLFLCQSEIFKKIGDISITLYSVLYKLSFEKEKITKKVLQQYGFTPALINEKLDLLKSVNLIDFKRNTSGRISSIQIVNDKKSNTIYWNKKNKTNIPLFQDIYYTQIPWMFLDARFYGNDYKFLKYKLIPIYLFISQFYKKNNICIFKGSLNQIRNNFNYRLDTVKEVLDFLESKKIIKIKNNIRSRDTIEITLDLDYVMIENNKFYKKKSELSEFSELDKDEKQSHVEITRNIFNEKCAEVTVEVEYKNKTIDKKLQYKYKNQKQSWKEIHKKKYKVSHLYDQFMELGFIYYNKRFQTTKESIVTQSIIKKTLEKQEWSIPYCSELLDYAYKKYGNKGFGFGILIHLHKEYQKEKSDDKKLSHLIEDDNNNIDTIAVKRKEFDIDKAISKHKNNSNKKNKDVYLNNLMDKITKKMKLNKIVDESDILFLKRAEAPIEFIKKVNKYNKSKAVT